MTSLIISCNGNGNDYSDDGKFDYALRLGYINERTNHEQGEIMAEKTLAIIKPDAIKKNVIGKIIQRIEDEGFTISGLRMLHLSKEEAKGFYIVHKDKPFYESLTDFMSSGEIIIMVLERENAIAHWREVMGVTDPALAESGTLRHTYGFSIERNAVHGSDGPETSDWEIDFFYKEKE